MTRIRFRGYMKWTGVHYAQFEIGRRGRVQNYVYVVHSEAHGRKIRAMARRSVWKAPNYTKGLAGQREGLDWFKVGPRWPACVLTS